MSTEHATLLDDPGQWIQAEIDRENKSESTRRGYIADLYAFYAWRDNRPLSRTLLEEYTTELEQVGHSPVTIRRALQALSWWARRLKEWVDNDSTVDATTREQVLAFVASVPKRQPAAESRPKGRESAKRELDLLMQACTSDQTPAGVRDAAIIALCGAGLHRSQIAELTYANFRQTGRAEGIIHVRTAGGKNEVVPIKNGTAEALLNWLTLRGNNLGPLFYAINSAGKVVWGHGVSEAALAQVLSGRAAQAGVQAPAG